MALRAVFPGSFDPLTVAHVAIASAARRHVGQLERIDLAMSLHPLGKDAESQDPVDERRADIERATAHLSWIGVAVVEARLVVDIAHAYDRVILGADKWEQLFDPVFYDHADQVDEVMARLCPAIVFRRPGHRVARLRASDVVLDLPTGVSEVSSSAVRDGRHEWRYGGGPPEVDGPRH